jgi:hypothetical protein
MRRVRTAGLFVAGAFTAGVVLLMPAYVSTHTPITTTITFQKEVSRIFQKKCFQCHTDGNLAMALTTYKEARPWAVAIKEEILERRMPPWSAVSAYGHFSNDMSLTGREVSLILSWADGGAPSGVLLADEDKQPQIVPSLGMWERGAPDLVIPVAASKKVAASARDYSTRYDITTTNSTPQWVRGIQLKPSDRRVVRYGAIHDATGKWIGTWTPGLPLSMLPENAGLRLAARAKITVEIGYRGTEEEAPADAELGFYYAEKAPAQTVATFDVTTAPLSIAPGKTGERLRGEMTLKAATTVTALWATPGAGATSVELTAIRPDGDVEPLLFLRYLRPEWPSPYVLREPEALPAGTRLIVTAYYDNAGDTAIQAKPAVAIAASSAALPSASRAR